MMAFALNIGDSEHIYLLEIDGRIIASPHPDLKKIGE